MEVRREDFNNDFRAELAHRLDRPAKVIGAAVGQVPIMILSLAFSKSSISTRRLLPRAANSAASFTRLARSAPEKPGVPRAMMSALTSGAIGTLRMCTMRICSRPRMSGNGVRFVFDGWLGGSK